MVYLHRIVSRRIVTLIIVSALLLGVLLSFSSPFGLGTAQAQNFENARVADCALAELGTSRPTGWNQPGECIVSAQRWVRNAGGYFGKGGVISGYKNSGAVSIAPGQAVKGDIVQWTDGNDGDWTHAHTVVIVQNYGNGRYWIVQSNWDGPGLVSQNKNWNQNPPYAGWYAMFWRFGNVAPPDPIRLNQGIWIRVGPYFQGGYFDSAYVLKNYGSRTLTILPAICARGPNNENFDLGDIGWHAIAPGQTVTVFKSTWLRAQGRFCVFATYRDQSGNWHDIGPGDGGTAHSATVNVEPITNYVRLSHGLWVHRDNPAVGEYFDAQFGVKNNATNNSVCFEPYLWVRGPGGSNQDLGGCGNIVLKPGQTYTCFRSRDSFGTALGTYTVGCCAHIGYAPSWTQWHDIPVGPGGNTTSAAITGTSPQRGASIVKSNLPSKMKPSEVKTIRVTVTNTSANVTWVKANKYVLAVSASYFGGSRVLELPAGGVYMPGTSVTFTTRIKACSKTGKYAIAVRMKKQGVAYFGNRVSKWITVAR